MNQPLRVVAFGASTSQASINRQLVSFAAGLLAEAQVEVLDLNDFELPLFSVDLERESGLPESAVRFFEKLGAADALLVSFAEHNGSYTAAFKNLFDWASRIDPKVYQGKPTVMLSTSPGARGGASVLAQATAAAPHVGADLRGSLSVPSFYENFVDGEVVDTDLGARLQDTVSLLQK